MVRFTRYVAAAALACSSQIALAQDAGWTISETAGSVSVVDQGGNRPAKRGMVIAEGATVSTGAGSRAVVVHGKDFVTVNPNSRIQIATATESRGLFDVLQQWGNALFQIEKKPVPHFGVRTPYLAAVVKGTTFSVTVTEQGASLQVVEGAVETSTSDGGARDLIRPGMVAMIAANDRYRLTVQGEETKTIDSPMRGTPDAQAPEAVPPTASADGDGVTVSDAGTTSSLDSTISSANAAGWQGADSQMLATSISAGSVDLGKATGGLVSGSAVSSIAGTEMAATRSVIADLRANDNAGGGNNNAGGNGNGNSGTGNNGIGLGAGLGNGNANVGVGVGNSNSGSGNNNAGGNGNGNAGTGNNGVGVGADANVGNGNASVGVGADASAGNGNAGVGVGIDTSAGNGNASVGVGVGVDASAGNGNAGVGVGIDTSAGNGNVNVGVGVGVGTGGDTNASSGTGSSGVDAGVNVGVGNLNVGVGASAGSGGLGLSLKAGIN